MSYITNQMIEHRVGAAALLQLADDDQDGIADVAVLDEIRLAAEGELNSYLARRFALPLELAGRAELAGLLASVALDLAEYRLRARRPPVPEDVTRLRASAVHWLDEVARGAVDLPADGLAPRPVTGIGPASLGPPRMMTREELESV